MDHKERKELAAITDAVINKYGLEYGMGEVKKRVEEKHGKSVSLHDFFKVLACTKYADDVRAGKHPNMKI